MPQLTLKLLVINNLSQQQKKDESNKSPTNEQKPNDQKSNGDTPPTDSSQQSSPSTHDTGQPKKDQKVEDKDKESTITSLEIEDYYPVKENTRYVYEGTGNEYASYNVMVDYVNESKVQQRIDNGGTVMANIVKIADGKLTRSYFRGEAYYRENLLKP